MRARRILWIFAATLLSTLAATAAPPTKPACRSAVLEGELNAGQPYSQPIGGGLKVFFQPIHPGWILRILPVSGPAPDHDYAELATPPYQSVTPLSISTDFAFRAQDAIGWNPRRFRFATSAAGFQRLRQAYLKFAAGGFNPSGDTQAELSRQIAQTSEGTFTIVDSRLIAGTADQWQMAAAVASHFNSTAHSFLPPPNGVTSLLGQIVWLRFRLQLDLPAEFAVNSAQRVQSRPCEVP